MMDHYWGSTLVSNRCFLKGSDFISFANNYAFNGYGYITSAGSLTLHFYNSFVLIKDYHAYQRISAIKWFRKYEALRIQNNKVFFFKLKAKMGKIHWKVVFDAKYIGFREIQNTLWKMHFKFKNLRKQNACIFKIC